MAEAGDRGEGKSGCRIKGNIGSGGKRLHHVPGSPNYTRTKIDEAKGERWFCSESEAEADGSRMGSKYLDIGARKISLLLLLTMTASLFVFPSTQGQTEDASVTIELNTRSAYSNVIVFHPDDVAYRRDNPWGWLRESFAYGPEAAEGRILAFTGDILGVVRLTSAELSEREQRWKGQPWTFRYRVRHGKVFVGTEDSLHYVDREPDPFYGKVLPEAGFELANGAYAVTVHPIRWQAEPGSMTSDRKRTADALPELVIVFKRVEDLGGIEATLTPVDFPVFLDGKPSPAPVAMPSFWTQGQHEQPAAEDDSRLHVLVTDPSTPVVTGFTLTVVDTDNVLATMKKLRIRRPPLALAPEAREGGLPLSLAALGDTKDPTRMIRPCA